MKPLEQIRRPVLIRFGRETYLQLQGLSRAQGLRPGPLCVHVMETIAKCPPERFHAAMAAFHDEANRRR